VPWIERRGRNFRVGWTENGRQHYKGGFKTKAEARAFSSRIEMSDVPLELMDISLASFAERLLETSWDLRGSTLYNYRRILDRDVPTQLKTKRLVDLTTEDFRVLFLQFEAGPSARRALYRILAKVLNAAERDGLITRSPLKSIPRPKEGRRREIQPLPIEDIETLASTITPYFRLAVFLAAYAGLRGGEIGGLRIQDVDLANNQLMIVQATARHGGQRVLGEVKTAAGHRRIDIPPFLSDAIRAHVDEHGTAEDGRLFRSFRDGLVINSILNNALKSACRKLALEPPRFHDLRHTCASLMIAAGAHPKMIQQHLGHSSISVTLDTYGHLLPSLGKTAAQALESARRKAQDGRELSPGLLVPPLVSAG